jgi:hypothetical protein
MALNFENVDVVLVQQLKMRFVFLKIEKRRNEIVFFRHEISTH